MAASSCQVEDQRRLAQARKEPNVRSRTDTNETLLISAEGYAQRCRELDGLRTEARSDLAEGLREARQDGHLDDNPALYDLFEEQAQLERRIALLEAQLAVAEIVAPADDGVVGIGSVVRVRDDTGTTGEYELVGPLESDVGNGRVSIEAPVGRALVGNRAGARVEVAAPRGALALEVVSVRAREPIAQEAA
jgi:transcription elongation factor GreA